MSPRSMSFGSGCSLAVIAGLFVGLSMIPQAQAGVAIPTPFEVSDSPSGNYLAGLIAGQNYDTFAASTYFQEALRFDPRNRELLERAFAATLANGDMDAAMRFAERTKSLDANNGLAQLTLGIRALKNRQYAIARGYFDQSAHMQGVGITANLLTAWAYVGNGDLKRALELVDRLPRENFGVFRDFHSALMADAANNVSEATSRFEAAYAAEKNTLRLVDAYARFLSYRGKQDKAIEILEAFLKNAPHNALIQNDLDLIKSGKKLDPVVRSAETGAAEVLYGLGGAGAQPGEEMAAMIYLRLSLYLNPKNDMAIMTVADLYERVKQFERAIDAFQMIPSGSPLKSSAETQTALALNSLGRKEEAIDLLNKMLVVHPDFAEGLSALGDLQSDHKDYKEAAETFTKLIALDQPPTRASWPIYYSRGISYERAKQWPNAEADFKEALELSPDQPLVLNYLGYSWIDQNIHLDEGFKMLRRAVDQRPNDGYIIDSLGWAFYRLGRYDEAVKELEKAVDAKPADPSINDHLGDAYWRVGRKLDARFQWNHARDLNPEPDDLQKILDKIKNGLPDVAAAPKSESQSNGG